jgi:subtilase family serine protease
LYTAKNSRGYTETVWAGAGSGCSQYSKVPKWQEPIEKSLGGCSKKLAADVSYIGNPNTGVAVYETIPGDGEAPGWQVWGGTSTGAPAIAAIYALAGDASSQKIPAEIAYANPGDLNDITSGSNGQCSPAYLCNGEVGYDGPTGLGTPNGLGAF